jgi:aryl-alcohol dehydrogenase-like predicted oxidoreductase
MQSRKFGQDGLTVPEIGLGCWQLGGGWGNEWDNNVAQQILEEAYQSGVRFIDTADVYGDGASELSIGEFKKSHPDIFIATKLGRAGLFPSNYTRETVRAATKKSLERLGVDQLDLTQLHCVPREVLEAGEIFDWLREQQSEGLIKRFGASVETVEEGLICLEQKGLTSLQVIFNIFRQKPLEKLLPMAQEKGVSIIVRLPLASGILSGKLTRESTFGASDHRNFNRDGQHFNVGETFAGIDYNRAIGFSEQVAAILPSEVPMAQAALRWILDNPAVSVVIPGASSPAQASANVSAASLAPLSAKVHSDLADLYHSDIHSAVRGAY